MLYVLTFSTYFFNFITVPYQTRVLGPEYFGKINFASSFVAYFQLFMDFGFILSGTEQVAQNRNSTENLSKIYTAICGAKLILISGATVVFIPVLLLCELVRDSSVVIILYYLSVCIYTFFPDYLYRGLENMKSITVRNVLIRIFFTVMIFIIVREAGDYIYIPLLTVMGNLIAVALTFFHLKKNFDISLSKVSFRMMTEQIKRSSLFFYSRVATTIYNSTNTFIIGILYGTGSSVLGYYSSANKLISTAKQGITPITDSLYPYMIAQKNYKTIKKVLLIFMPIITVGCLCTFLLSDYICVILFGEEFREAGLYLRLLIPLVWVSFPAMLFGFPMLSPLGLSKYVNYSNIVGACVQVALLIIGFVSGTINIVYICIATCLSDFIAMSYRIAVFLLYKKGYIKGKINI